MSIKRLTFLLALFYFTSTPVLATYTGKWRKDYPKEEVKKEKHFS
jgi:hypothetical protein